MKLAVMQPYFMPYIGYWQLIKLVDTFVFYDDVNFIKKGYINRNNILVNGNSSMFTIPLIKPSQNRLIKDIEISYTEDWIEKFLKKLVYNYKKAPSFDEVYSLIESELNKRYNKVSELNIGITKLTCSYLNIKTNFLVSSELQIGTEKKGQERILGISRFLKANHYINPSGGREIYNDELFIENEIKLNFINSDSTISYKQLKCEFVPWLSMIDVLMFNSVAEVNDLLEKFKLN